MATAARFPRIVLSVRLLGGRACALLRRRRLCACSSRSGSAMSARPDTTSARIGEKLLAVRAATCIDSGARRLSARAWRRAGRCLRTTAHAAAAPRRCCGRALRSRSCTVHSTTASWVRLRGLFYWLLATRADSFRAHPVLRKEAPRSRHQQKLRPLTTLRRTKTSGSGRLHAPPPSRTRRRRPAGRPLSALAHQTRGELAMSPLTSRPTSLQSTC